MIPEAVIAHSSTGRLRIKLSSYKDNLSALKSLGDQIAACPGIISIEVNPTTASILLLHQSSVNEIVNFARSNNLFTIREQKGRKEPSADLRRNIGETFNNFDRQIQSLTDGELDLKGVAFAGLIVAGTAQLIAGNAVAIPWFAAYWYAYHLYSRSKEGGKN